MSEMSQENQLTYTYILAGGGMAGLSLAYYLNQSNVPFESIVIIDQALKNTRDKTWCYWSDQVEPFDSVVEHSWNQLWFHSFDNRSDKFSIRPFNYRKIQSDSWYAFIQKELKQNPKIQFIQAKVLEFSYEGRFAKVRTDAGEFTATEKIFDSISHFPCELENSQHLKQHFVGITIEANFPIFDPEAAHLFDFRIAHTTACEFMYVLPTSDRIALFEHTYFSGQLKEKQHYLDQIKAYLFGAYGLGDDDYLILEEESGIIPMTMSDAEPQNLHTKIIQIGTSGGFVKATTGYSFLRTQRKLKELVTNLENRYLDASVNETKPFKKWMDRVFLQVLIDQKIKGNRVFESLFQKNKPQLILRFLEEETTIWEDLKLMTTVPTLPFMQAAFKIGLADLPFTKK
jgi:lycopene beta-cyclase